MTPSERPPREPAPLTPSNPAAALSVPPPLAGMCAFAALCSMVLNQIALPMLGTHGEQLTIVRLTRSGQFVENLAVISGMIALVASAIAVARGEGNLSIGRRAFGVLLTTMLMRAVVIATLLERQDTTKENVYLAVGAADALCVLCGMVSIDAARSLLARSIALLATSVPLLGLLATTLALTTDVSFDPWKRRSHELLETLGELAYLALLLASAFAFVPRTRRARDLAARAAGFAAFGAVVALLHVARGSLHADFSLLLYHAQHVNLFLDRAPFVYALPFGAALATASAAMLAGGPRFQAGAALLLIFASSHAPQAPGRLLTMTLGFVLLARAQSVFEEHA